MKFYFIAGETSGDTHGAALMQELRALWPDAKFHGCGGPRMQALAEPGFLDWTSEAVVGLWDVIKKYPYFKRRMAATLAEIAQLNPDAVIFIDYPGFNLRAASALRKAGSRAKRVFFISPQVWAWHRGRIPQMARDLDLMLCIFPFEKQLYEQSGLRTEFVGHPLVETLRDKRDSIPREPALLALFPGSRDREVRRLFPLMLETSARLLVSHPHLNCEAAAASEHLQELMQTQLTTSPLSTRCKITLRSSLSLMQRATAGIVASGTATMEAACLGLPFVLVYKVAPLTWWIGKRLVRVPHLGMPNILAGREIVREFLQHDARADRIAPELASMLDDPDRRAAQQQQFRRVVEKLGEGQCAHRAALEIARLIHGT